MLAIMMGVIVRLLGELCFVKREGEKNTRRGG